MRTISVVIPFYQCETGVLGRALRSIEAQDIPAGWRLLVVIVDDGSPLPAKREIADFELTEPRYLKVVEQQNAGVGSARNRGLDIATPESDAIAFLDSDDIWPAGHVRRAIEALDAGFDFYFTDNWRAGVHESHIRSPHVARTAVLIDRVDEKSGIIELPHDEIVGLCLLEFPCQASTIVYRKTVAPLLRFNTSIESSGEDVLFFTELLARCRRVGFDLESSVECGDGVNIYFKNLGWDTPRFLSIITDQLIIYRLLAQAQFLSPINRNLSYERIESLTDQLSYHFIRNLIKNPGKAIQQVWRLCRIDFGAAVMVLSRTPKSAIMKLSGHLFPVKAD